MEEEHKFSYKRRITIIITDKPTIMDMETLPFCNLPTPT